MNDQFKAEREWLANLKVGDQVLVSHRYSVNDEVRVVDHLTARYLTVQGLRYNRQTGYACGESSLSLRMPTPALLERIETNALRKRLSWVKWDTTPLPKLRAVAAILDAKEEAGL